MTALLAIGWEPELRGIAGAKRVEVTARDGLMAVGIGTAAEISAREHRVVEMRELGF